MGLLTKAGHLESEKGLAFSDFINKYKLKFFAVLEKKDNNFFIKNSIGFDGASIISAGSTSDYWNGICRNLNELYVFKKNDGSISPLLQLFSFSQKDDLEMISVIKTTPERIFLVCNQEVQEECLRAFSHIQETKQIINLDSVNHLITRYSKVLKIEIDYEEAAQSFIRAQIKDKKLAESYENPVFNEISNRFLCFFARNVSINTSAHSIRAIFIINRELRQEHLVNHIILNLSEVIGNYSEIINFCYEGEAQSIPEIKAYLRME